MKKLRWYQYVVTPIVWVLAQLYRQNFGLVYNLFGNLFALIELSRNGGIISAYKDYKDLKKRLVTFDDFVAFYNEFEYTFDGIMENPPKWLSVFKKYPTWTALPFITVSNGMKGNCQDASFLAKIMLRKYKEVKVKHNIYVPINPKHLNKVHYIVTIRIDGFVFQFSNGKITNESKNQLANRYLGNEKRDKKINYIWL